MVTGLVVVLIVMHCQIVSMVQSHDTLIHILAMLVLDFANYVLDLARLILDSARILNSAK